jgi:hypothetical protein
LTHFSERQFWYLTSRSRSTCGVRPYVRATCNPDPDSFVRRLIDWWIGEDGLAIQERSGVLRWFVRDGDDLVWGDSSEELSARFPQVDADGNRIYLPKSLTFVPASHDDNTALLAADPGYRATLMALPLVDRSRLLGGNWNVRDAAGSYFRRQWFPILEQAPHPSEVVCGLYAVNAASGRVLVAEDNATGTPLRWIACVGEFISPPLSAKSPIEALQAEIMALLDVLNETRKLLSLFATYPREFNPRTVVETHAREKNCILLIGALRQSLQAEFFGGAS